MAFKFRVVFTGICTVVPHKNGESMIALLVDGRDAESTVVPKKGLDDEPLSRHVGFVKFPLMALPGVGAELSDGSAIWYPDGDRISIKPMGTGVHQFKVQQMPHIPRLEDFAGTMAAVDPNALKLKDPSAGSPILAQVVIQDGKVSQEPAKPTQWKFNGNLGMPVKTLQLSHRLVVDMGTVDSVEVTVTRLASGPGSNSSKLVQLDTGTADLDLEISNLCDRNPLGWVGKEVGPIDDADFRWHYELVGERAAIGAKLQSGTKKNPLPHPIPLPSPPPAFAAPKAVPKVTAAALAGYSVHGDNCYKTILPAYAYDPCLLQ